MEKIDKLRGKSLMDTHPELVRESWNFEKNIDILPEEVTLGSHYKVWWKCKEGHSWKVEVCKRTSGTGCPYCSGRKAIKGVNDLATTHPKLLEEWDFEKNEIKPEEVMSGSGKKVWWKCEQGHSWQAIILSRTQGHGCPYCSNRKIKVDYNDLATTNSELLEEWDYEKNEISPTEVSAGSGIKVWWKCKEGHSWKAKVSKRTSGKGCPYCSNRKIKVGYNDLATTNPEMLEEWNYEKNEIRPTEVVAGSGKKVWWRCKEGHSWQSTINNRTNGKGCPYCSGSKKN